MANVDTAERVDARERVVNVSVRALRARGYASLVEWLAADPRHVYIGRSLEHYVRGAHASLWANPYTVKRFGRDGALARYREHVEASDDLLAALPELADAVLGCWCAPERCHGHVLLELLAERTATAAERRPAAECTARGDDDDDVAAEAGDAAVS